MVTSMRVDGVDISHWQSGTLNYASAKTAGVKFVYHKATEGNTYKDPNYTKRRAEVKAAGIPFGAYHFARASSNADDGAAEAKFFLSVAKPVPGDLAPALDIETMEGLSLAQIRAWSKEFIAYVKKEVGVNPVVYTPYDLGTVDDGCIIWRPRYNNDNKPPVLKWDIWQFSNGVYGVPKSVAGFGNVDLNTMRSGLKVSDFQIPKKETVPPVAAKTEDVLVWHASLEFSDSLAQREADIKKIFTTAKSRGVAWLTGTEGFEKSQRDLLKKYAEANGYRMHIPAGQDSWVSVRKDRIAGGYTNYYSGMVVDGKAGLYSNKGTVAAFWEDKTLGEVCAVACHYVTKGTPASSDPERRKRIPLNKDLANDVGRYAKLMGGQGYRVFYGGDQNIEDSKADTFFGQPLTSCWDDLKKYPGTGHGTIDVIARYNGNKGCKVKSARSYNDTAFFLNTDHFLVEAVYTMTLAGSTPAPTPTPTTPTVNLAKLIKAAKTDPGAKQGYQTYAAGTKVVEAALLKEGLLAKKYATDGSFGSTTVAAYKKWQKKLGYTGKDADGIPGAASLKKLGKKYGFTVK